MKGILAILLLAMVALFNSVECTNPGITTAVNLGAINGLIKKVLPPAVQAIRNTPIPDVHEKKGRETTNVSNIRLKNFDIGAITLTPVSSTTVSLRISNLNIGVGAKIKYKKKKKRWYGISKKFSGNVEGRIYDSNVNINFSVGSLNGQPKVNIHDASVSMKKIKVKLKKKWYSFLINFVLRIFRSQIKKAIVKTINTTFRSSIQNIANGLTASAHVKKTIAGLGFINLGLVKSVYIQNNNIIAGLDGEITPNSATMNTPRHAITMPKTDSHFSFLIDTAVFESYFQTIKRGNKFNVIADASNTRGLPVPFTANGWTTLLPAMSKYGNAAMRCQIVLNPSHNPSVVAKPGTITSTIQTLYKYQVLQNGKWIDVFGINDTSSLGVKLSLSGTTANQQVLSIAITQWKSNLSFQSSSVGQFSLDLQNFGAQILKDTLIIPAVNNLLYKGIPLPSIDALGFKNLRFNILKDAVLLHTDIIY